MIRIWAKIANGYFCLMMRMQQSVIAVVTMYYIAVVPVFKVVTRQTLKNAKLNITCDIEKAQTGQITVTSDALKIKVTTIVLQYCIYFYF